MDGSHDPFGPMDRWAMVLFAMGFGPMGLWAMDPRASGPWAMGCRPWVQAPIGPRAMSPWVLGPHAQNIPGNLQRICSDPARLLRSSGKSAHDCNSDSLSTRARGQGREFLGFLGLLAIVLRTVGRFSCNGGLILFEVWSYSLRAAGYFSWDCWLLLLGLQDNFLVTVGIFSLNCGQFF